MLAVCDVTLICQSGTASRWRRRFVQAPHGHWLPHGLDVLAAHCGASACTTLGGAAPSYAVASSISRNCCKRRQLSQRLQARAALTWLDAQQNQPAKAWQILARRAFYRDAITSCKSSALPPHAIEEVLLNAALRRARLPQQVEFV